MDEPLPPTDTPELYTFGDLDPIHGQVIEMDYTGRVVAGRYTVQCHIGSGGMADVYRARDERLCRDIALKILKPRLASEEWCARMFQEARASAAIDHPHLLRITDVGRVGPSIYLAMDLLQGTSLEAVLRAQPMCRLPWRRAIELILPVLGAFQAAHERGFIHRDIKPDNLFLHRRGDKEHLVVLDLGIVKRMPAEAVDSVRLPATATGYILGTPAYMSPEQANGVPLDARTDIYSLGVTLYRMMTGHLPFAASPGEPYLVLAKHVYESPPRFAEVTAAALDCPECLEQVVMRALAKHPDGRYPGVQAFAAALRACLEPGAEYAETPLLPKLRRIDGTRLAPRIEPTPSGSIRLQGFGQVLVIAALAGALVAWRGPAIHEHAARSISLLDEPEVPSVPTYDRLLPARIDAPASPTFVPAPSTTMILPEEDPRRVRRVLDKASAAVGRCVDRHGDPDARSYTVELTVAATGVVKAARGLDAGVTLVDACIRDVLMAIKTRPGPAVKLRHTFSFTGGRP